MRTSRIFEPADPAALATFIREQPLAVVVSSLASEIEATPLPLLADTDAEGNIVALVGHFARSNRHVQMLERNPRAIAVFLGAHGYVSPSWMRDRTQAPTWNFQTAHFVVDVAFCATQDQTADAVGRLVNAMENGRPNRWHATELGDRYDKLIKHVIGFRASVVDARVKFKMGQNERPDVYADILSGLAHGGNQMVAEAMRRHNPAR